MEIKIEGIVAIVGSYGSGKTEVAINLAVNRKRAGIDVRIADLDLVNPYFRTREARKQLSDLGVGVVLPAERYLNADLPILSPAVSGLIRQPGELTILDVGGNNVGANVLAALSDAFSGRKVEMTQVINPFRPFTDTIDGCLRIRREIEGAARLSMTSIIGNPNLIEETTVGSIYDGHDFLAGLAEETGLPLRFISVDVALLNSLDTGQISCPVLPIERQLVPPWKKPTRLGPENFRVKNYL